MPWKLNGEGWHLGEKGFPPGKKLRWDRALLPRLLALVREVEPKVKVEWDARDCVKLKVPGVGRSWAIWRTKEADSLDCRFLGKKGQLNLSRLELFGVAPELHSQRSDGDVVRLRFRSAEQVHAEELKKLLAEQLAGFREEFGR